ncbi:MAG: hypothetical protein AAGE61_16795, partial [Pseudomonadota bacterium]
VSDPALEARLAGCNVNPSTGLATNYLNHFIETLLLFEILPEMPDCIEDINEWRPMNYLEHVRTSDLKNSDLIERAYHAAAPETRTELNAVSGAANQFIVDCRDKALRALETDDQERLKAIALLVKAASHDFIADLNRIVQTGTREPEMLDQLASS